MNCGRKMKEWCGDDKIVNVLKYIIEDVDFEDGNEIWKIMNIIVNVRGEDV